MLATTYPVFLMLIGYQVRDRLSFMRSLDDNWRTWYADSAYRFVEHEEKLAADNMPGQICEKDTRGHPLTDAQKETNWVKSNVRALVEHVFSAQAQKWGHIVRTIG